MDRMNPILLRLSSLLLIPLFLGMLIMPFTQQLLQEQVVELIEEMPVLPEEEKESNPEEYKGSLPADPFDLSLHDTRIFLTFFPSGDTEFAPETPVPPPRC